MNIGVEAIKALARNAPVLYSRRDAAKLLGLSPGRLANLDSLGEGPPRFRAGRRVYYPSATFFEWIARRVEETQAKAQMPGRTEAGG